jgi:hypothetical protein
MHSLVRWDHKHVADDIERDQQGDALPERPRAEELAGMHPLPRDTDDDRVGARGNDEEPDAARREQGQCLLREHVGRRHLGDFALADGLLQPSPLGAAQT